jgi:hypothetical protein
MAALANVENGKESYEHYRDRKGRNLVQYDYRHIDGELFTCVKSSLEQCRASRDAWLEGKR